MAKVDNIIQKIRSAQAESIAKNGGVTANNYDKVVKETTAAIKPKSPAVNVYANAGRQRDREQRLQDSRPKAPTASAPEKTTKQKLDEAQLLYDTYIQSEEHGRALLAANQKEKTDQWTTAAITGDSYKIQRPAKDPKEQELKALVDHYTQQMQKEKIDRIDRRNMGILKTWSEEDLAVLDEYVTARDMNSDKLALAGLNLNVRLKYIDKENNAKSQLEEKYGKETLERLAETYGRQKHKEDAETAATQSAELAKAHPVGGALLARGGNLMAGFSAIPNTLAAMRQNTGQYPTLDPYVRGRVHAIAAGAMDQQNVQGIQEALPGAVGDAAGMLYRGVTTTADSALSFFAGGGAVGGSVLMASRTFDQTLSDASARGATPKEAVAMATTAASIEYLSEKIPLDNLVDAAKAGGRGVAEIVKNGLMQGGIEATTEEISLISTTLAEAAILREKAGHQQRIQELVAEGVPLAEAQKTAMDELLREAWETAVVSFFSGELSGTSAAIVGNLATNNAPEITADTQQEQADADNLETVVEQTQQNVAPEVTEEVQQEQPVQTSPEAPVADEGQRIVDAVAAELAQQMPEPEPATPLTEEQQQMEAGVAATLDEVLGKVGESQTGASNSMAEAVMRDPEALDALIQATGAEIAGSKAEQRRAVKEALNRMFSGQPSEVVDTATVAGYDNSNTSQERTANYGTEIDNGRNGRNPEIDSGVLSSQGTANSGGDVQSGDPGRISGGYGEGIVHASDSEGRGLAPEISERIRGTAVTDTEGRPLASNVQEQSAEGGQGSDITGTGAAGGNFSGKPAYNATLSEDNSQADRRDDVRPMELPRQDINGGNVSAVTGNVYGSKITPDEFASLMEEPTAKGDFTYAKITNDQATHRATETIASAGTWENAYDSWKQSVTVGNAGAEMSARGALFLNHAAQQGNKQLWLETLHYMQKLGTNTAQGLQAFRIIRTLKPVDKIEFVRMSVDKMATEINEKYGIDLEIDQTLINEFEQADTDEARDAVLEDIQQNVADQIPSTFLDKWTALRYMNMLGNLKTTSVRNTAGNIGSAAVYRIKDTIAAGMEAIASKIDGGNTERTKSLFVRKSLLNACKEDFQQFKETVSSGGKYGERMSATNQFEQGVQDKRRIFKNSALEAYRRGTNWMMNNEYFGDEAFGRAAYSRALAGYLQANGVTGSDLSEVDGALLDKARAYAIKEAQEATFHDNSTLAKIVSKVQKDTGIVGQGIMPFTKTPANVLTRAEEFSPLGLINSTVKSIQKARGNENITGADVINSWAKSVTGVGLFALGAAMMDQGLLSGGPDEDEEKAEFDELNGQQNYAIQLPDGTNYTIDWLTPAAMPMFMGAQFWKMLSSDRDLTFADMEQVFTSIADPMIQMSMLQGLNDSLDGIKYSDNNLGQFFINAAVSYLTQGLTNTLMGQLERSTEENRQTTYIDKNSNIPEWMQRQLGKASQKVPGWDFQQMDYRNAWGQTEKNEGGLLYNMLSPGYVSKEQSNQITQELYRLRETTGENVFPQAVEKTVTYTDITGEKHVNRALTQSELDTIQRVEGRTAARLMAEIVTNDDYKSLTDDQRAEVIANVYKYAQEQGKKDALAGYYSDAAAWLQNMGDDAANGLIQRAALSTINSSVTKIVDNIENEWTVSPAAQQELDGLFDAYSGMSKEAQKQILDNAVSDTAKYLEIRSRGINTEQYLGVVGDIKKLEVEPNYSDVRDIQIREAIAGSGALSTKEKDIVMRAYMPDYDPTAKSPQTTELKYDAIRDLGVSPQGYTDAYRAYLNASGSGKRRRTIAQYRKDYGWDQSTAQKVYDIYAGYYKPWE